MAGEAESGAQIPPRKDVRLSGRITRDTEWAAKRAAAYEHMSYSAFVERAIREKAHAVIYEHEVLDLGVEASRAMIDAWLAPTPIPAKLAEALAVHDALVLSDV